jgi:hypothetical protein
MGKKSAARNSPQHKNREYSVKYKTAIIAGKQMEAVDKVICFLMDNWKQVDGCKDSKAIQRHLSTLDYLVQEQW